MQQYYNQQFVPVMQNPQEYFIEQQKKKQRKDIVKVGFGLGATIIIYLIMQVVFVSVLTAFKQMDTYNSNPAFQYCSNIVGVHFFAMLIPFMLLALMFRKNFVSPLIPAKKVGNPEAFCWVLWGMGCSTLANIFVNIIMKLVESLTDYKLTQGEMQDPDSLFACVMLVLSTAIIPGIVEELALRCCTLGILRKFGKGFAVFAVSIVFGLLHGNVIQFIFAFLVGIVLAYITIKTDNVIIAMLVHGLNNGISVINDLVAYFSNDKTGTLVSNIIFYIFMISSIAAFVYLINKRKFKVEKVQKPVGDNSFFVKLLCLLPGLAIPFAILIFATVKTIVKQ